MGLEAHASERTEEEDEDEDKEEEAEEEVFPSYGTDHPAPLRKSGGRFRGGHGDP